MRDQTDVLIAALQCLGKTFKGIRYGHHFFIGEGKYTIEMRLLMVTVLSTSDPEERMGPAARNLRT